MRAKVTISILLEAQLHLRDDLLIEHGICHVGSPHKNQRLCR